MKALKILLATGCVLGLELGSALGQGESFVCTQCICVADGSCDGSVSNCSTNDAECETKLFTAACSGNYTVRYSLDCSGTTCALCFACVFVADSEGNVIAESVCHGSCTENDCTNDCEVTISLTADNEYKLRVCKRICAGGSCSNCTSCVARGFVYIGGNFPTACATIPTCAP